MVFYVWGLQESWLIEITALIWHVNHLGPVSCFFFSILNSSQGTGVTATAAGLRAGNISFTEMFIFVHTRIL